MVSYEGTSSTNDKRIHRINQDLAGRSVVIIEDIVDRNTIEELHHIFSKQNVKQLKWHFSFKPEAYKKDFPIDYVGTEFQTNLS
jgi:hypoxanthine-guanine phosphoribosyltransferase